MLGGKFNLGSLVKNAKKVRDIMQKAQQELASVRVVGEAGAGLVKVTITAQHEVTQLQLADELLKEPKEIIEDLVKAAFNDASRKAAKITQEKMLSAGAMFDLPGDQEEGDE